jgi:hypothetical protein
MVETFTPAVCGSRRRQRLALLCFALGALVASALVGAALGALGQLLGMRVAMVAAALALLAAAREAGLLPLPLPQSRRQVPERWRAELPLPVWGTGYGAGLGAGFLTFQPVSTFWVACVAAVALGRPFLGALCFAAYGGGRTIMAVLPLRGRQDPTAAVEALTRRRRTLLRANVAALVACAALLASAQAAGATVTNMGPGVDPTVAATVFARAQISSGTWNVSVEPSGEPRVLVPGASAPSVDGDLLAYDDSGGIKVVNWRTGGAVAQVDGAVSKPALDWPLLAFVRTDPSYKHLVLADFTDPSSPTDREIASVLAKNEIGRPALAGGRIAWGKITSRESRITVEQLATQKRTVIARSVITQVANPALSNTRIVWVEQRAKSAVLRLRRLDRTTARTIYAVSRPPRQLWTTALLGRDAYVVRWSLATRAPYVVHIRF